MVGASAAGVIAILPLIYLVIRLGETEPARIWEVLTRPRTWQLMGYTVWLTVSVAATTLIVGIVSAVLLVRTRFAGRRAFAVLAALPLAMPSYVAAYTWIASFDVSGFFGTWLVMSAVTVPYVTLPVAAALHAADPAVEEVARSLGHSPVEAFRRVTLPQILPAASAGSLLVALYTVSEYGTPSLMRYDALTNALVTSYTASFDRSTAFVFALSLVVLAGLVVALENLSRSKAKQWRLSRGAARPVVARPVWPVLPWLFLSVPALVALVVPGVTLLQRIINRGGAAFNAGELIQAIANTLVLAGGGALLALVLALPVGVLAARWNSKRVRIIESAAFTGNALPGVVVGLSLVAGTLAVVPFLYQTIATVAIAYAVLFLPKAVGAVRTATAAVPPVLEETARSLGRSALRTWLTVTLRITAPGVATGGLLALLAAMKELPATLLLRPTGMDTLATEMWTRTTVTAYSEAAPYALALVLLAAIPAFLLSPAPRDIGTPS